MNLIEHWKDQKPPRKKAVPPPKEKPTILFGSLVFGKVGHSGMVYRVFNHPDPRVNGHGYVRTSPIVKVHSPEKFETENSFYVKKKNTTS